MFKLFKFVLITLLISASYLIYERKSLPTQITPYPYLVSEIDEQEIQKAQSSQVLILGDINGVLLAPTIKRAIKQVSKKLNTPLSLYNWSRKNEGMHRSLEKLNSLDKIPHLVIYFGGASEFYEKIFEVEKAENILSNFKRRTNDYFATSIMLVPFLSKVIYQPIKHLIIDKEIPNYSFDFNELSGHLVQKYQQTLFKIFEYEVEEFISHVRLAGKTPLIITSPNKVTIKPQVICSNTITDTIIEMQHYIQKRMDKGRYKEIYDKITDLSRVAIGNAKVFYQLGVVEQKLGRNRLALKSFQLAKIFDCFPSGGNQVINNILLAKSKQKGAIVIDFDKQVHRDFGKDYLFLDDIKPQEKYYNHLEKQLIRNINNVFKL